MSAQLKKQTQQAIGPSKQGKQISWIPQLGSQQPH